MCHLSFSRENEHTDLPHFLAAFKAELDKTSSAPERKALLIKLTSTLEAIRSPLRTAEAFGIEEMIDPRDTRRLACEVRLLALAGEPSISGADHSH